MVRRSGNKGKVAMLFPQIPLLKNPRLAQKITIIEGPDGVGKTTLVNELKAAFAAEGLELRQVRCPDNRGGVKIRDVIFSQEIGEHPSAQLFLFVADMLYGFDSLVKPFLDDPNVYFLFDRFLPSTCVYQQANISYINQLLGERYPEFSKAFGDAHYIYLTPRDLESHKARLAKKQGDEINHLDPVGDDAIRTQILNYCQFASDHQEIGLLGSRKIDVFAV